MDSVHTLREMSQNMDGGGRKERAISNLCIAYPGHSTDTV